VVGAAGEAREGVELATSSDIKAGELEMGDGCGVARGEDARIGKGAIGVSTSLELADRNLELASIN